MSRILIVDDDQDIARILKFRLSKKGFDCILASNGIEALEKVDTCHPDLVLLDVMMPKMDGFTACREIRKRTAWSHIPVIMLTAKGDTLDKVSGISEGADDYVVKPFEFDELLARIQMILRRTQESISANPLTGLPGNHVIGRKLASSIRAGEGFAACYVDLDHFKAYNDEYGFEAGDRILKHVANLLVQAVDEKTTKGFVGHIGGDDFLLVTSLEAFETCCQEVIRQFDKTIPEFYSADHQKRGYIEAINRQGQHVQFPIMTVSIGIVTSNDKNITDAMQVSNRASEMKKFAKGQDGSVYAVDRRIAGANGGEVEIGPVAHGPKASIPSADSASWTADVEADQKDTGIA